MEFRILGPLEVRDGDREVSPARPKQRALLAVFLLRANHVVPVDELLDALWGERLPKTATSALHGHVSSLRKLLGADAIETRPAGYALRLDAGELDLDRFESLLAEAGRIADPGRRSELLHSGLSLVRGEPLEEFRYDSFFQEAAGRIDAMRLSALEDWIDAELELGRHEAVLPELERLVAANGLRERLRGQLMLALYRAGRQADALNAYQEARRELAEELGLEPGRQLQDLERRILRHDATLEPPARAKVEGAGQKHPERKRVTLLSCDLAGIGEDVEDVEARLEPAVAAAKHELERFGGTVQSSFGGSIVAVYGAPTTHEDDPERAVRAALAILDAVPAEFEPRVRVETTAAIVTGDELGAGPFRLPIPEPNRIVVDENTRRATARVITYLGQEPVEVRTAPDDRPRTEFVGRRRELDQLADALARAQAEHSGQLLTLIGEPGIGKTRLVRELYALVESEPQAVTWLEGRSLPYGDGVTFWALGEIVKAQAGVFESDPSDAVKEKLRLAVEETSTEESEVAWMLRHLQTLVGLGGDGARGEGRAEAFAAWRRFFKALAEQTPLVLVVEDLHWADDGLLDFVDELAGSVTDVPLLVIATSRPELLERRSGWSGGKRNAITLSLAPLSNEETRLLLSELLGSEVDPALVERVQGNPLYAEEYARLALEQGARELGIPESLQALIAARLDALPVAEKALVQDAAVVGEVSWAGAIAAVGGTESPFVEDLAEGLELKAFLRRRRPSAVEGEAEYAFGHVLVRDIAYEQIPRAERGEKHRLAAEWIESLGRREDHVELLAHHYVRALELARALGRDTGELAERARLALRDAGDRAAALSVLPAASRFYEQALEIWPEDAERPKLMVRQARAALFTEIEGEDNLVAAAEQLVATGNLLGAAHAEGLLVALYQEEGRGELARRHLDRACELVTELPPTQEKAEVLAEICRSRMMSGEYEESIRVGSEALALCDELGLDEVSATVLNCVGPSRLDAADPQGAIKDLERGIAVAQPIDSHELAHGYGNLADALLVLGDLPGAYEARRVALQHAERLGVRWYIRWLRIQELEELYYGRGAWDELLARAKTLEQERTIIATSAYALATRVRVAQGDTAGALADAERTLDLARASRDLQALGPGLVAAALAEHAAGERDDTEALVDELIATLNWRSLFTYFWVAPLASVLHDLGRGEELVERAAGMQVRTTWLDAGIASASGDFGRAAAIYADLGSRPDEAYARLRSGEDVEQALAFFRSVGATAYIREAEALAQSTMPSSSSDSRSSSGSR